ncbi:MAG: hypothetical protein K2H64_04565 [Desulfovibrio sp.]|nr:hypothetical protein [Desulfovibrio sp.]
MSMAKLSELRHPLTASPSSVVSMNMDTVGGFESMQRAAKLFASSTIIPKAYQGNIPNCFIAVDMAMRMQANPLMVMQNLYIVHGNPAWSAQFLIATFNKSGRFSALRYEFQGTEEQDDWGCRATAMELATNEKLVGPLITIAMPKKNGWYQKEGSKWQSMSEQMLRYRGAAWFIRVYAPEIAMGLQTAEEVRDATIVMEPDADGNFEMLDELKLPQKTESDPAQVESGEIIESVEESAEDKQTADKQRAAKAVARSKAKETDQADLQNMTTVITQEGFPV